MKIKIFAILLMVSITISLIGCAPGQSIPTETAAVDEEHFSVLSISEASMGGEKTARVSILTDISIIDHQLTLSLLDQSENTLLSYEDNKIEKVAAGSTFSVYIPLGGIEFKKIDSVKIDGTATTRDVLGEYLLEVNPRVTFLCGETSWAKRSVPQGEPILCPDTPVIDGKIFEGWYADKEYQIPFDFSSGISFDTVAYAKLSDDIGDTVNRITKELMTACVTVRSTYLPTSFWESPLESTSSGVVIRKGTVSYILTNSHSTTLIEGYGKIEIEIEDCFGNVYPAAIASYGESIASDPAYDLAILAAFGMSEKTSAIELANENPIKGERVYSIGSPAGQQNAITVGEITDFLNVKLDAEEYLTNVEFGVLSHTAEVRRGSSGGALVNSNLELVGINYAGKDGNEFSYGYAIPINKIHEFIDRYM